MEIRYCEQCGNPIRVELGQPAGVVDRAVCEACSSGSEKGGEGEAAQSKKGEIADLLDSSNLNLFSPQTIVLHKQKLGLSGVSAEKPKSTKLKLVKPGSGSLAVGPRKSSAQIPAQPPRAPSTVVAHLEGATSPAKSAQKIVFRCMHCRSTLSIRPIEKTSKLTCPHCTKEIFITISGRVLRMSPSMVVKKGEDLKPRSVRIERPGSERAPLVDSAPIPGASNAAASLQQPGSGSVRVVKPGSARLVKTASSRVLKNAAPSTQEPQAAPAKSPSVRIQTDRIGTARIPAPPVKQPSVRTASSTSPRLLSECPSTSTSAKPPSARVVPVAQSAQAKPCSAFEEHQARQDPEKTVFITEEPTSDLSALANVDAIKNAGKEKPVGAVAPKPKAGPSPLLSDASDLLETDAGVACTSSGDSSPARSSEESTAQGKGIAQRVLKALFSP